MQRTKRIVVACAGLAMVPQTIQAADPYADQVIEYVPGTTADPSYTNSQAALGPPERFTGEGVYPCVVSIFNPPWLTSEVVSVGDGGKLTVKFDEPIVDDPGHRFGADLIVFGNAGFIDVDYPSGRTGTPAGLFGTGLGKVEVSADGIDFFQIPGVAADQLFPTQGYNDSGPQDAAPGNDPTNFLRPVDPSLTLGDFDGLSYAEALGLYDGSGGGLPIDLAAAVDLQGQPANLVSASYVRISHAGGGTTEIDAIAAVPEPPAGLFLTAAMGALPARRRKRRAGGR